MSKQWNEDDFFIGEEEFEERMNSDLLEFRKEHYKEGTFFGVDDKRIHYVFLKHPNERAAVVISHGFCEFVRKYDEVIYYFYQLGYSVYLVEHRGHGYSYRLLDEMDKVHATNFFDYERDFKIFIDQVVKKESPDAELFLFAHSMGGCIGALVLEEYPKLFKAAVLSSPMMEMNYGKVPKCMVKLLADWSVLANWQTRYVPGKHGFDNVYAFSTSSTLSEPRYAYIFRLRQEIPQYRTYGATYGWTREALKGSKRAVKNASKITAPVLLLQAGFDTMVMPKAQEKFVARANNAKMVRFADSKHEIFNALETTRKSYWNEVFTFFEEQL